MMKTLDLTPKELIQSDPNSLYQMALQLRSGDGVHQNLVCARRFFGFVALYGHAASTYMIGLMNAKGEGGSKHLTRALMWFRLAVELNEPCARAQVERLSGKLTPHLLKRVDIWVTHAYQVQKKFAKVAKEIDWEAEAYLGCKIFEGIGAEPDPKLALHWLLPAATRDYADAQVILAKAYAYGIGVISNPSEAKRMFRLAASQEHIEAHFEWAHFLEQHSVDRATRIEAVELYDTAARFGHLKSQVRLGQLFRQAEANSIDESDRLPDSKIPAQRGPAVYKKSHSPNLVCSFRYVRMAAEQGHVESQFELGQMYAQGVGTIQNFEEAVKFFELAAQQGHAKAQFNLAFMIARGQGTEENSQKSYEWYTISHLCGYQIASQSMAVAAKKITSKEVELANWRAESFVHQLCDRIDDSYSH